MKEQKLLINNIPAVIYGEKSDKVFLFVHGKCGNKEEGKYFFETIKDFGYQVLSIDLPLHGERKNEKEGFYPWVVVPQLQGVMKYIKANWKNVSLRCNSIGSWFSLLAFSDEIFEKCLFVSPILDMSKLISNMMEWSNVKANELEEKKIIKTDFGEDLNYEYYIFAKKNKIIKWNSLTYILYATKDNLTSLETVTDFSKQFNCELSIMENGEHWFHTEKQLEFLNSWTVKIMSK